MTEDTTPQIEVTIAAPVDAVWDALRDKEKIRHWHGWDFEGLAEEIDLIYFTDVEEDAGAYDQKDAEGFIKLNALRMRIAAAKGRN